MKKPIAILMVEDTHGFVMEINRQLLRSGLAFCAKRAATEEAFIHELVFHCPDVILSNGGLPSFDGLAALSIAREKRPDVPFIFVTDSPEAEAGRAVEAGITSEVLKSPLSKLAPMVRRALREANKRNKLREMELRILTARWMDKAAKTARLGR